MDVLYMIVSHCATGRGRTVRRVGVALCDGYPSQCATLLGELSTFSHSLESAVLLRYAWVLATFKRLRG